MKKIIPGIVLMLLLILSAVGIMFYNIFNETPVSQLACSKPSRQLWQTQSIDTMKYSRDHADKHMHDKYFMNELVPKQVADIASTGATHIAINTPYDKQFQPMLKRWVEVARKHDLKVFFRGNWAGWEGWFEHPKDLSRQGHIEKTREFILNNKEFFEDGDIFSACPECENGGPGDPRRTKDVGGHRKFLIDEYDVMQEAFGKIGKKVDVANFSMNGDVAQLVMDKDTTKSLGGVVAIDHYVKMPKDLADDAKKYAEKSGGKIFVAELGAPVGHVHGNMSEVKQAKWIDESLDLLAKDENVTGINYWVNMKGSTALWNVDGTPRKAVDVLTKFYKPKVVYGKVSDELGTPLEDALVSSHCRESFTDSNGCFAIKFIDKDDVCSDDEKLNIFKIGFERKEIVNGDARRIDGVLIKENKSFIFRLKQLVKRLKGKKTARSS